MTIVKLEVPISDYYGEEVFFKTYYFEVYGSSPDKNTTIKAITKVHEENLDYPEYTNEDGEAIGILEDVKEWCFVGSNGLLMTNTFVEHPQFGEQPVTWSVVKPIQIN